MATPPLQALQRGAPQIRRIWRKQWHRGKSHGVLSVMKTDATKAVREAQQDATISVNLGRDAQLALLDDERFTRTPYIGQHGWATVSQTRLGQKELELLVVDSWRRVATKKQLAQR